MTKSCAIAVLLTLFVALSAPGQIIYDNGPVNIGGASGVTSQIGLDGTSGRDFDAQVADDFSLSTGNGMQYNVTGITFRGFYFNPGDPGLGGVEDFNVIFYDDAGGVPTGGPTDPTGTNIGFANAIGIGSATGNAGQYDWTLDISNSMILLDPDTTYWVAVQAVLDSPPQWGWGSDLMGGNAAQGFPSLMVDYWTPTGSIGAGAEMQFQLLGNQNAIPEPASGVILFAGIIGILVRRRR